MFLSFNKLRFGEFAADPRYPYAYVFSNFSLGDKNNEAFYAGYAVASLAHLFNVYLVFLVDINGFRRKLAWSSETALSFFAKIFHNVFTSH